MSAAVVERVLGWYAEAARDLPWRQPGVSPYAVLVSEVMLQQTPVVRVLPAFESWMTRWPTVGALAAAATSEVLREWGRLGYPRRALRLQEAARVCVSEHGGQVPSDVAALRALPGVGDYTAAAVASFAFGQRHAVLDTNVRRVLGRVVRGDAMPPASLRADEVRTAVELLPDDDRAPLWSVAVMELGALVCTARSPRCDRCPIAQDCSWSLLGRPASTTTRRVQAFAGTDRQVRGLIMAALRSSAGPVPASVLREVWADEEQRERALQGLIADGLAVSAGSGYALPA